MEGRSTAAAAEGCDRDSEGLGIGTVTKRVRQRKRGMPTTSKLGPILADVAGTPILKLEGLREGGHHLEVDLEKYLYQF